MTQFYEQLTNKLKKTLNRKNIHQYPKLNKIILSCNLGLKAQTKLTLLKHIDILKIISAQTPCLTQTKKAISNFKIRKGMISGVYVTLRKKNMLLFFEKFILLTLPCIKDFKGISKSNFDTNGNLTLGFNDLDIFPELYNIISSNEGLQITFNFKQLYPTDSYTFFEVCGISLLN